MFLFHSGKKKVRRSDTSQEVGSSTAVLFLCLWQYFRLQVQRSLRV